MRLVLLSVAVLVLAACATAGPEGGSRSRLLYIAGAKAPCTSGAVRAECLQYRETPKQPWQVTSASLEGLEWKAGNEYLLKVTEVPVRSSTAGTSSATWHVDKVVEQHPVAE
jgi:hypothetical protein